jgi:uncharacterized protein
MAEEGIGRSLFPHHPQRRPVSTFKIFRWSFVVTALSLVAAALYGGVEAFILTAILGVMEVSLSFDNAVVNARILERMSEFWQKIFLTVGIVIAVFGMRIIFPLVVVSVATGMNPLEAFGLAMEKGDPETPGTYGYVIGESMPVIAGFGGMFLLMLFLDFVTEERDITWLAWVEKPLARIGQLNNAPVLVALVALVLVSQTLADDPAIVLLSGVAGMVTYLLVNGLGSMFESVEARREERYAEIDADALPGIHGSAEAIDRAMGARSGPTRVAKAAGKAGFFLFMYLEVLDASFSFDGVIGAFAITADPIIIALGLGLVGAMFVRSLTVFLVRKGTLNEFVYLDHGAHWAIGALAVILLLEVGLHINEIITGLIGVVLIGLSFLSSVRFNRRQTHETEVTDLESANA